MHTNQATILGILVVMPSLLSRVIESQGQDAEIASIRDQVQVGTGDEGWAMHMDGSLQGSSSPVDQAERRDPPGVPLLPIRYSSRWHKDVSRSSSPILLEWDEARRWRFCSMVSHMSVGKG